MTRSFRSGNLRVDISLTGARVVTVATFLPGSESRVLSDEGLDNPSDALTVFDCKCQSFLFVGFEPVEESE